MYDVVTIDYRDIYGKLLWTEPMQFRRLHAVGEQMAHDGQTYIVERVAIADQTQHVNLRKARDLQKTETKT